jgi:hypothetical protein
MLQRLTEDGTVRYLVVHKLDRLARNLEDHTRVRAMLRNAGVQLISVTESIEDSASGKLVEEILASIAEFYSANLSQEIKKVAKREKHKAEATVFLGKRLNQLANERERLLKAYYAEAFDVDTLKREQARIDADVAEAEAQLSGESTKLKEAMEVIELALSLAERCSEGLEADPEVRKLWNQVFFRKIVVKTGRSAQAVYEEPFASLLGSRKGAGSHKNKIVELPGIEPGSSDPVTGLLRA